MIRLSEATLDIPVLNSSSFSLKKHIISRFSAKIRADRKRHSIVRALDHISFSADLGEKIALIGSNGSGKSSLLRVLAGVYTPTYGEVSIDAPVNAMIDIMIGMDPDLTGLDNIMLKAKYDGIPKSELDTYVADIRQFSELDDFLYLPIKTYSSGMLMRLSFGIATHGAPNILILDEWVSVGDLRFAEKAKERLKRQIDRASVLIFASHDLQTLNAVCARGIVLENGSIAFDGPIAEAIAHYEQQAA